MQISPGWKLHEHPLKRTKPNFGTNKAMASSTWMGGSWKMGCTQTFCCHNSILGDVLSRGFWQRLGVCCPHVKVTYEHSDDTLEWLSHVPWIGWIGWNCTGRKKCVKKMWDVAQPLWLQTLLCIKDEKRDVFLLNLTSCILAGTSYCLIQNSRL